MSISMRRLLPLVFALVSNPILWADATLFVQEPYALFGAINPTGHTSIYLSRVCAETPVVLRLCDPGELGIVISRYRKISGYDWIAIPLIPYLYAVEDVADIPEQANTEMVAYLRDDYRRKHLREIAPDGPDGETPKGSWAELVGAIYNRKIYGFHIETTKAQDEELISALNSRKNKSRFNLFFNNCADFSRRILNFYYPGTIKRNYISDLGITTPQQIAKNLVSFSKHHPGLPLSAFFLPQVLGSRRPSHRVDGVSESLLKSKKYILPIAALNPWVAGGILAVYLANGRFNVAHYAETEYAPMDLLTMQDFGTSRGNELAQGK